MRHFSLGRIRTRCAHRFAQGTGLRLARGVWPAGIARIGTVLLALAWLSCVQPATASELVTAVTPGPVAASSADAPVGSSSYYVNVAKLDHPLLPFEHLPKSALIQVHAAVVTLPDPVETRLGRSFDIELAALTSAFQASDYVLDGFAFAWAPRELDPHGDQKVSNDRKERELPSVMLFRKDDWRNCGQGMVTTEHFCGSTYFALFLVGETPRSGVHPLAFARAARCAMALDGGAGRGGTFRQPGDFNSADCDQLPAGDPDAGPGPPACTRRLNVIGPAFSGSMESMAAALSQAASVAAGTKCGRRTPPAKASAGSLETATRVSHLTQDLLTYLRTHWGVLFAPPVKAAAGSFDIALLSPLANVLPPMPDLLTYLQTRTIWGKLFAPPVKAAKGSLDIRLLSPSASIDSNDGVQYHNYLSAAATDGIQVHLQYRSLAYSVSDQMWDLLRYLHKHTGRPDNKIVVFSEESSFGMGAARVAEDEKNAQVFNVQFPPNIASIRAEHVRIRQAMDTQRRQIVSGRLLELDLTGVDQGVDQPPSYQASLSSRSDELMLYQTFDALNKYVQPVAVVVVATDVRDRLFLLSQIRNAFPGTLPVVLEQDNLLVHPDYRTTSRGSITMPAGRTLVCLNRAEGGAAIADCSAGGTPQKSAVSPPGDKQGNLHYFAFATDYAANTFRAIVQLANNPAGLPAVPAQLPPAMLVATLAGFQEIQDCPAADWGFSMLVGCPQRGIPIVADTRLQLQQPIYLAMGFFFILMLLARWWLVWNGRGLALAVLPVIRLTLRRTRLPAPVLELPGRISVTWLRAWLALALGGLIVAAARLYGELGSVRNHSDFLAHGRDAWTLLGLCLAYGCFVLFAALRGQAWNTHCADLAKALPDDSRLRTRLRPPGYWRAIFGTLALFLGLYLTVSDRTPTSVDSPWISALGGLFALGGSTFFLIVFLEGLDRWWRICLEFGKTIHVIQNQSGAKEWPTPDMLDEQPRSPFNTVMRLENYCAWRKQGTEPWIAQTDVLLADKWPFRSASDGSFARWQAQLVAEMKLAAVAVRTAAWCSILGAVLALMLIQVYPPVYERLQTMVAAILLALGSASVVYAVITLEKDRLLGRMFTGSKDHLTFGGALSALWTKLLALGILLVMIFLPDVWDWFGGFVKAINSFH